MANEGEHATNGGKKGIIVWILLAVGAVGAGAAAPWILGSHRSETQTQKKAEAAPTKQTAIPFDDVVVNLGEDRFHRYLRVKLMVAVEEPDAREVTELLAQHKAFLKSWLIGYLSDQTSAEVGRKVGVNRLRREIRDEFNARLYPNGEEKVVEILFDMFVVQQ